MSSRACLIKINSEVYPTLYALHPPTAHGANRKLPILLRFSSAATSHSSRTRVSGGLAQSLVYAIRRSTTLVVLESYYECRHSADMVVLPRMQELPLVGPLTL